MVIRLYINFKKRSPSLSGPRIISLPQLISTLSPFSTTASSARIVLELHQSPPQKKKKKKKKQPAKKVNIKIKCKSLGKFYSRGGPFKTTGFWSSSLKFAIFFIPLWYLCDPRSKIVWSQFGVFLTLSQHPPKAYNRSDRNIETKKQRR